MTGRRLEGPFTELEQRLASILSDLDIDSDDTDANAMNAAVAIDTLLFEAARIAFTIGDSKRSLRAPELRIVRDWVDASKVSLARYMNHIEELED